MNLVKSNKEKTTKELDVKEVIKNVKNLREHLKIIFKEKKEIKQSFENKIKQVKRQIEENQKWFDEKRQKLEKIEIQSLLWWDFWRREIEINRLQKQAGIGTLPSEREKIDEEIEILNNRNKEIEKGFRGGKIDTEMITKLRKEIEEELEKEEQK